MAIHLEQNGCVATVNGVLAAEFLPVGDSSAKDASYVVTGARRSRNGERLDCIVMSRTSMRSSLSSATAATLFFRTASYEHNVPFSSASSDQTHLGSFLK